MQAFQKDLEQFKKLRAEVIGISPDSIKTHEAFSKEFGLTFPLVSDGHGAVKNSFGNGRITFLIDTRGVIRFIQEGVPDNSRILKKLREIEGGKK